MSARDLAIGLLLGGGGTNPMSIQALIDNGNYLDTIVINDKYRLDLYAINWMFLRPPTRGVSGFDFTSANVFRSYNQIPTPDVKGTDSDGTIRAGYFGRYIYCQVYYIAYKNNDPILAARCISQMGSELFGAYKSTETPTYTVKALPTQVYYTDASTFTLSTTNFTLYNQYYDTWNGGIFDADTGNAAYGTAESITYNYGRWRDNDGVLHAKLNDIRQQTYNYNFQSTPDSPIYADNYNEACEKWLELYKAVNRIYYNVEIADIVLEQPFDPPEEV